VWMIYDVCVFEDFVMCGCFMMCVWVFYDVCVFEDFVMCVCFLGCFMMCVFLRIL